MPPTQKAGKHVHKGAHTQKKRQKVMSVYHWIEKTMKSKYLTIRHIVKMKRGQKIKFLCYDRNFCDCVADAPSPAKPSILCSKCYIVEYIHDHDLHGKAKFMCDSAFEPFDFHLNYSGDCYYPLDDKGRLPNVDPQGFADFTGVKRDYRDFPQSTYVGWRGPILLWSDVQKSNVLVEVPPWEDDGIDYEAMYRRERSKKSWLSNMFDDMYNNVKTAYNRYDLYRQNQRDLRFFEEQAQKKEKAQKKESHAH